MPERTLRRKVVSNPVCKKSSPVKKGYLDIVDLAGLFVSRPGIGFLEGWEIKVQVSQT